MTISDLKAFSVLNQKIASLEKEKTVLTEAIADMEHARFKELMVPVQHLSVGKTFGELALQKDSS
jgi:hypothetical protein